MSIVNTTTTIVHVVITSVKDVYLAVTYVTVFAFKGVSIGFNLLPFRRNR